MALIVDGLRPRTRSVFVFTPASTTNTISGVDSRGYLLKYTVGEGNIDVMVNGLVIPPTQYTATNGTSITFTSQTVTTTDRVTIIAFAPFEVTNALIKGNNLSELSDKAVARQNLGVSWYSVDNFTPDGSSNQLVLNFPLTAKKLRVHVGAVTTAAGAYLNFRTRNLANDGWISDNTYITTRWFNPTNTTFTVDRVVSTQGQVSAPADSDSLESEITFSRVGARIVFGAVSHAYSGGLVSMNSYLRGWATNSNTPLILLYVTAGMIGNNSWVKTECLI